MQNQLHSSCCFIKFCFLSLLSTIGTNPAIESAFLIRSNQNRDENKRKNRTYQSPSNKTNDRLLSRSERKVYGLCRLAHRKRRVHQSQELQIHGIVQSSWAHFVDRLVRRAKLSVGDDRSDDNDNHNKNISIYRQE